MNKINIKDVINRNEATIQAELYRQLVNNGIKCYLEIKIKNHNRKLNSIVDLVVCDNNEDIVFFIEVKANKRSSNKKKNTTIQEDRYIELQKYYNIPYIYCYGYDDVKSIVRKMIRFLSD